MQVGESRMSARQNVYPCHIRFRIAYKACAMLIKTSAVFISKHFIKKILGVCSFQLKLVDRLPPLTEEQIRATKCVAQLHQHMVDRGWFVLSEAACAGPSMHMAGVNQRPRWCLLTDPPISSWVTVGHQCSKPGPDGHHS